MKESVMSLLESELTTDLHINSDFNSLQEVTSNQARLLGYTPEKVIIMKENNGPYLIEFSNNLERYMAENDLSLDEAMRSIEEMNNIERSSIAIVLRESDIGKLKLDTLKEEFNFLKYTE